MTKSTTGRILALDVGHKRIGVAVSDLEGRLAQPLLVYTRKNRDQDAKALAKLAKEQQAGLLVVGLPRKSADELGPAAEKAMSLGKRVARLAGLPLEFVDEFETTAQAEQVLLAADASRGKRREVIDKLAACLILERYLGGEREGIS